MGAASPNPCITRETQIDVRFGLNAVQMHAMSICDSSAIISSPPGLRILGPAGVVTYQKRRQKVYGPMTVLDSERVLNQPISISVRCRK